MRRKAVIFWAVVVVLAFAATSGCDSREEEKYAAIVEAAQGRAALAATQVSLARAEREKELLASELGRLIEEREKLVSEVNEVKSERDAAVARQSQLEQTMRQLEQKAKATEG